MKRLFYILVFISVAVNVLLIQDVFKLGGQSLIDRAIAYTEYKDHSVEIDSAQLVTLTKAQSINLFLDSLALADTLWKEPEGVKHALVKEPTPTKIETKRELRKAARKSILQEYSVAIYPASAKNEVNLNLSGMANESFGVYIISKQGKVEAFYDFAANTASERKMSLDISQLDRGTYFAHLVGKGDRVVKKFVKI